MGKRAEDPVAEQRTDGRQVAPMGFEQGIRHRDAQAGKQIVHSEAETIEHDGARQRIAVRVEPRRGKPDQHVTGRG